MPEKYEKEEVDDEMKFMMKVLVARVLIYMPMVPSAVSNSFNFNGVISNDIHIGDSSNHELAPSSSPLASLLPSAATVLIL